MASTKLSFLGVAVLLLQASWCAVARHHHDPDPCGNPDPAHRCSSSLAVSPNSATTAVMSLTSFEADGSGSPAACDGEFHINGDPLAALSTKFYAGGSRCLKGIFITSTQTGLTVRVEVVDECGSDSGCKDNEISTSFAVWAALGLDQNMGEAPITWSTIPYTNFDMGVPMQYAQIKLSWLQLPDPEYIGSGQFDPALPAVHPNLPSIWIRPVRWLTHVLSYLGVQEVDKETFQVGNSTVWKGCVDFSNPRPGNAAQPIELSVYGKHTIDATLAEKNAVIASVDLLADTGYVLPTYSSMLMQYMDEEALYCNVEHLCLTKVPDGSMTYTGFSFEAIFDQCMRRCGYTWEYASESPPLTTQGYQAKLQATKKGSAGGPLLIILSRPCRRPAEAVESVLCTELTYISDDCGYKIGDLHYGQLMIRRFQRQHPGILPA